METGGSNILRKKITLEFNNELIVTLDGVGPPKVAIESISSSGLLILKFDQAMMFDEHFITNVTKRKDKDIQIIYKTGYLPDTEGFRKSYLKGYEFTYAEKN